jgi:hypothetical protein
MNMKIILFHILILPTLFCCKDATVSNIDKTFYCQKQPPSYRNDFRECNTDNNWATPNTKTFKTNYAYCFNSKGSIMVSEYFYICTPSLEECESWKGISPSLCILTLPNER